MGAARTKDPTIIKKYANRRLYNTGTSTYVTLEDLARMVKAGEDFVVHDAKSGEDITRPVLTQIIFEQENKGQNLLPIAFLRQLIRFYGDSLQALVPSFLEFSIDNLTREQQSLRDTMGEQMAAGWAGSAGGPAWQGGYAALEEQARANMAMFEQAFRMFTPFGRQSQAQPGGGPAPRPDAKPAARPEGRPESLDDLKRELAEMRNRLDRMDQQA